MIIFPRIVFAGILAFMLWVTTRASMDTAIWQLPAPLTGDLLFQATLADACCGFLTFFVCARANCRPSPSPLRSGSVGAVFSAHECKETTASPFKRVLAGAIPVVGATFLYAVSRRKRPTRVKGPQTLYLSRQRGEALALAPHDEPGEKQARNVNLGFRNRGRHQLAGSQQLGAGAEIGKGDVC